MIFTERTDLKSFVKSNEKTLNYKQQRLLFRKYKNSPNPVSFIGNHATSAFLPQFRASRTSPRLIPVKYYLQKILT